MRTIVKGKNAEIDRVRSTRTQGQADRAAAGRSDRCHRRALARAPQERRRLPLRRGDPGHPRPGPAQPGDRRDLPGGARRRSSTRSSGRPSTTRRSPRLRAPPGGEADPPTPGRRQPSGPRREPRIVKVKRFAIEPMFEEDAVARMEELGHQFFVFVSAETERVAILYRRDDGDFGHDRAGRRRRLHHAPQQSPSAPGEPPRLEPDPLGSRRGRHRGVDVPPACASRSRAWAVAGVARAGARPGLTPDESRGSSRRLPGVGGCGSARYSGQIAGVGRALDADGPRRDRRGTLGFERR